MKIGWCRVKMSSKFWLGVLKGFLNFFWVLNLFLECFLVLFGIKFVGVEIIEIFLFLLDVYFSGNLNILLIFEKWIFNIMYFKKCY